MLVLVVGATGVLGRQVLPRLVERGHTVRAVVRRAEQAAQLQRVGIDARLGDILDAESLQAAAAGCDAALHLATAIPKTGSERDWGRNDRIRREGTQNLLAAARTHGVTRYVQQSITFIYGTQNDRVADEETPLQSTASAVDMEGFVRASGLSWCILRGGAFYGPGTDQEATWRQDAAQGTLRLPGDGEGWISLIHVVDIARAVVLATEQTTSGTLYNVVDDTPVRYRELFGHIAAQAGGPQPAPGGAAGLSSLACSNRRIKAELGWQPAYPSYRSGLA